jgi:hypothetical protein
MRLSVGGNSKVAADTHDEAIPLASKVVLTTSDAALWSRVFIDCKGVELTQYDIQILGLSFIKV